MVKKRQGGEERFDANRGSLVAGDRMRAAGE
jgi:hypothetical protein